MSTLKSKIVSLIERTPEEENSLKVLFVDELKDIYWAEKHLVKGLKKLAEGSTSDKLKNAFTTHLSETEGQIARLEQVFKSIGEEAEAIKCEAMNGLLKEADELLGDTEEGTEVRDVALISAAQKCEHYEIATYGTLKTLAGTLGYEEAKSLLEETLQEEKNADKLLSKIAEAGVNVSASKEKE